MNGLTKTVKIINDLFYQVDPDMFKKVLASVYPWVEAMSR